MGKKNLFKKMSLMCIMGAIIILGVGCQKWSGAAKPASVSTENITVSAAASMKDAIAEVAEIYKESHPEITLTVNLGGSGTLAQQIEQGAEVDVFLSASKKQMNGLVDKGLIASDQTMDLLGNKLLLVAPKATKLSIKTLDDLQQAEVKSIAVGEPKSVPAGQYAVEALENLKLMDQVASKMIYGKDVKEVLMWVETGNVDAGIVYATDAKMSTEVQILAEVPTDSHSPIVYPVGLVKASKHTEATQVFIDYLNSNEAKAIFEKYGFITF